MSFSYDAGHSEKDHAIGYDTLSYLYWMIFYHDY